MRLELIKANTNIIDRTAGLVVFSSVKDEYEKMPQLLLTDVITGYNRIIKGESTEIDDFLNQLEQISTPEAILLKNFIAFQKSPNPSGQLTAVSVSHDLINKFADFLENQTNADKFISVSNFSQETGEFSYRERRAKLIDKYPNGPTNNQQLTEGIYFAEDDAQLRGGSSLVVTATNQRTALPGVASSSEGTFADTMKKLDIITLANSPEEVQKAIGIKVTDDDKKFLQAVLVRLHRSYSLADPDIKRMAKILAYQEPQIKEFEQAVKEQNYRLRLGRYKQQYNQDHSPLEDYLLRNPHGSFNDFKANNPNSDINQEIFQQTKIKLLNINLTTSSVSTSRLFPETETRLAALVAASQIDTKEIAQLETVAKKPSPGIKESTEALKAIGLDTDMIQNLFTGNNDGLREYLHQLTILFSPSPSKNQQVTQEGARAREEATQVTRRRTILEERDAGGSQFDTKMKELVKVRNMSKEHHDSIRRYFDNQTYGTLTSLLDDDFRYKEQYDYDTQHPSAAPRLIFGGLARMVLTEPKYRNLFGHAWDTATMGQRFHDMLVAESKKPGEVSGDIGIFFVPRLETVDSSGHKTIAAPWEDPDAYEHIYKVDTPHLKHKIGFESLNFNVRKDEEKIFNTGNSFIDELLSQGVINRDDLLSIASKQEPTPKKKKEEDAEEESTDSTKYTITANALSKRLNEKIAAELGEIEKRIAAGTVNKEDAYKDIIAKYGFHSAKPGSIDEGLGLLISDYYRKPTFNPKQLGIILNEFFKRMDKYLVEFHKNNVDIDYRLTPAGQTEIMAKGTIERWNNREKNMKSFARQPVNRGIFSS
jgi:hypothetical protein